MLYNHNDVLAPAYFYHKYNSILFLTARIEENDKVQGFSVGGDDYIVKPFSLVELEARVQAHLRREERHQTNTKVKFSGELLIDYSERTVYIQNQPIGLNLIDIGFQHTLTAHCID